MVLMTERYQACGSRRERRIFASGKAASWACQRLQEGQSTVAA